jgi:hypothetical protein
MSLSGKQLRNAERALHIAAGVILLAIAFTPLADAGIGQALRFVVAPMLVVSGILMWQHARVTRLMRGTEAAPPRARAEGR